MKKLLCLALVALLLLPVLPTYASEVTKVTVASHHDFANKLEVVIDAAEGFTGADITVGDRVSYTYEGEGEGTHKAYVDISDIDNKGTYTVCVTANYEGFSEYFEKSVNIGKFEISGKTIDTPLVAHPHGFRTVNHELSKEIKGSFSVNDSYWTTEGYTQIDVTKAMDPALTGYVEYSFDFRPTSKIKELRLRMTANTGTGAAFKFKPTGTQTNESYRYFIQNFSNVGLNGVEYNLSAWNTFKVVADFINLKYSIYVNDVLAEDGAIGVTAGTDDFIVDARTIINNERDVTVDFDNFKFASYKEMPSWGVTSTSFADGKILFVTSEDIGELGSGSVALYNEQGDKIGVKSVAKTSDCEYEVIPSATLLYGQEYDICLKNGTKSPSGSVALKEPAEDDNGDGYWKVATVKSAKYTLNVESITDNGNSVSVMFNNTDISDKWAAVCWYDANGALVDLAINSLVEVYNGDVITFSRNNSDSASDIKVNIFAFNQDAESSDYGAVDMIEIYSE